MQLHLIALSLSTHLCIAHGLVNRALIVCEYARRGEGNRDVGGVAHELRTKVEQQHVAILQKPIVGPSCVAVVQNGLVNVNIARPQQQTPCRRTHVSPATNPTTTSASCQPLCLSKEGRQQRPTTRHMATKLALLIVFVHGNWTTRLNARRVVQHSKCSRTKDAGSHRSTAPNPAAQCRAVVRTHTLESSRSARKSGFHGRDVIHTTHHHDTPPQHTTTTHHNNTPPQHHHNAPPQHTTTTHHHNTPPHHPDAAVALVANQAPHTITPQKRQPRKAHTIRAKHDALDTGLQVAVPSGPMLRDASCTRAPAIHVATNAVHVTHMHCAYHALFVRQPRTAELN